MTESEFEGKSIIIAAPNHFGIPEILKKNLEFLGFQVFLLRHDSTRLKLKTSESLIHFVKKTFTKDRTYKAVLTAKRKEDRQLSFLNSINKTDYALVIRPDLFSSDVLASIREKSSFSSAYQWDGMDRFPLAVKTVKYFDNFFVFDENDTLKYPGTKHITNFYFDYLPKDQNIEQDVYFVGTFMKDRIQEIAALSLKFKESGLKTNLNIIYDKEKHVKNYRKYPINFSKKAISFEENMINAKMSNIILDFKNSFHIGVSFRTFEAIGYRKKLITNNSLVKNYDFYNPNNIFVFTNENINEVGNFLSKDYVKLSSEIINQYSFSNWIKKVLTVN